MNFCSGRVLPSVFGDRPLRREGLRRVRETWNQSGGGSEWDLDGGGRLLFALTTDDESSPGGQDCWTQTTTLTSFPPFPV